MRGWLTDCSSDVLVPGGTCQANPSHSISFGNNAEKDTAGCRASHRNSYCNRREYGRIGDMEYIDLRKVGGDGLKEIRRQVVRLKKMGKTGKEIEELTGVRQNRASEIWTAYQREGESSLERKKYGRNPGSGMVLTDDEQGKIRKAVEEKIPEDSCRRSFAAPKS